MVLVFPQTGHFTAGVLEFSCIPLPLIGQRKRTATCGRMRNPAYLIRLYADHQLRRQLS